MLIQRLIAEWGPFAEVMTREEQDLVAWLWQAAERHTSAIGHQDPPDIMHGILFAFAMELLRENRKLAARLGHLEQLLAGTSPADSPIAHAPAVESSPPA
jgi:hypothetical protein